MYSPAISLSKKLAKMNFGMRKQPYPRRFSKPIIWAFAIIIAALSGMFNADFVWADGDIPTKFSNMDSVTNSRHNMSQSAIGIGSVNMNAYRNNYNAVCVYCHTPHGASDSVPEMPLWNRTKTNATYTTYDSLASVTMQGAVEAPGPHSLSCLSCHDGTVAVDSIINMPGAGNYLASQATSTNSGFLNTWTNSVGADASVHMKLAPSECMACHSSEAGVLGAGAADFTAGYISTDLTDDHPIGVVFPAKDSRTDFRYPDGLKGTINFFDDDGDSRPDPREIRLYSSKVECASCHDPHGVNQTGSSGAFFPNFLRKASSGSQVCQACHIK